MFLVLGVFYTSQNWSHERYWQKQREDFAVKIQEREATLTVDDTGLTGSYSEIVAFVPWKHIREYTLVSDYLFIHFRGPEIFVIPLRYISTSEKESLMDTLSTHGIRAKLTSQPRS